MIKKISLSLILICLFVAIPLALLGYDKVQIGPSGLAFLRAVDQTFKDNYYEIPDIPKIPNFEVGTVWFTVLNFLINVVNGLSTLINVIVDIFNVLVHIVEYLVFIVYHAITFKDSVTPITTVSMLL